MKNYKNYLFDLDGTLITTTELIIACFNYSIPKYLGFQPEREKMIRLIGLPFKEQIQIQLRDSGQELTSSKMEQLEKDHLDYQLTVWPKYLASFPQVKKTLSSLKNREKKLGIVTSRKRKTTQLFLEHENLIDYFDIIVTPEDTTLHKPHKAPIEYAMKKIGALEDQTIYIGDSIYDMLAAESSGIDRAYIRWGDQAISSEIHISGNPTYLINNFKSFLN